MYFVRAFFFARILPHRRRKKWKIIITIYGERTTARLKYQANEYNKFGKETLALEKIVTIKSEVENSWVRTAQINGKGKWMNKVEEVGREKTDERK